MILGGLRPAEPEQGHLFAARTLEQREDERRLMAAMDGLNARYGSGAVHVASAAAGMSRRHEAWQMRHERRSPAYATSWSGLCRVG